MRVDWPDSGRVAQIAGALFIIMVGGCGSGEPPAPSGLKYTSPNLFPIGSAIAPLQPTVSGTVTQYSVAPALPAGLTINSTSGVVSGTPTAPTPATTYRITAQNSSGSVSFDLSIAVNASPGGIWVGTDPISLTPVLGLVAETGELFFNAGGAINGGVYYVGQFTVDGNTINADIDAIAMQSSHYPDSATWGMGTLGGQIIERTSIDGGVTVNTYPAPPAEGHTYSNSLSLTFSSQYNRASSLATIAGNYGPSSLALTISADGVLFAQDAVTGCVINGAITTIDTRFNMYAVTLSTMNCAAELGVPDGAQLKGLATLNNSQVPEYVLIRVADTVSAMKSAMTIAENRM